jgi:glycosyltransferase involved in cell wall biosynthesis
MADTTSPADGDRFAVGLVLSSSTGGIGSHVRALADDLAAAGQRVTVLGPAATQHRFAFARDGGAVRFGVAEIGQRRLVAHTRAVGRIRQLECDAAVIHAHGLRAAAVCAVALRRVRARRADDHRVAFVVTLHNAASGSVVRRALTWFAIRRVVAAADVTLVVSPDIVGAGPRRHGAVDRALIAAPPRHPTSDRATTRQRLGVETATPLVLAVGRLHPQKGFDVLVAAAALVRSSHVITIAGEGPQRARLETLIASAAVDVRLLGERTDVADLLAAADLVVMPSRWEGWPLVAAEVLSAGRPFVASDVGGLPELVGDAAVLVPASDAPALAKAIERLIAEPAEREVLSAAAYARAATLPTTDDVATSVLATYRRVVGTR